MSANASGLKLYRVIPHKDADWQVLVVHHSWRQAKAMGYDAFPCSDAGDFIDCRVRLVREITPPDTETVPRIIETWVCRKCAGINDAVGKDGKPVDVAPLERLSIAAREEGKG